MANIPAGYSQATFIFSGTPVPSGAVVTLGLQVTNEDDQATNAATLYSLFVDDVLTDLNEALMLSGVLLKDGPSDIGSSVLHSGSILGGEGGAALAPNTSVLVSKNTANGGRKNKGRLFIPGFLEGKVNNSGGITTDLGTMQNHWDDFHSELLTAGLVPVLLHANEDDAPTPITSFSVQGTVATQRRRLRR